MLLIKVFLAMLQYNPNLKYISRRLRKGMTESEQVLWLQLRRRQLLGVQFYRQKPIGNYVVDFYAPEAKLMIEVDGSQHLDANHTQHDARRDLFLASQGLKVLRFNNLQVLQERHAVLELIFKTLGERLKKSPRHLPLSQRGIKGDLTRCPDNQCQNKTNAGILNQKADR